MQNASGRSALSEVVTDVLVEHGDRDVARYVAMNRRARFSGQGMVMLMRRAASDVILAQKLGERHDVRDVTRRAPAQSLNGSKGPRVVER